MSEKRRGGARPEEGAALSAAPERINNSSVGVLATLRVDARHAGRIRAALLALAEQATQEEGTELFTVHEADGQEGYFVVFERYRDDAAVLAHRASAAMDGFRTALRSAGVRPEIVFLAPLSP